MVHILFYFLHCFCIVLIYIIHFFWYIGLGYVKMWINLNKILFNIFAGFAFGDDE